MELKNAAESPVSQQSLKVPIEKELAVGGRGKGPFTNVPMRAGR